MKKVFYLLAFISFFTMKGQAQVTIGSDKDPDDDAVLELISNDKKGFLLPRLELTATSESAPLSKHVAGMLVYNTGDNIPKGYYYNDGTQWVLIADTNSAPWRNSDTNEPAQSNTEDIYQDASVGIGSATIDANAQLDITSDSKGILLPRLSTQQRDAISATVANGLLIYNTTTNCFNYYEGSIGKWLSLCGTYDPAKFEFLDCTGGPSGSYKAGVSLTSLNKYTVTIRVSEPGTYRIVLNTTNGYSFSKSGTFTETGTYTLELDGQGTPANEATVGSGGLNIPQAEFNGQKVAPEGCTLPGITVDPSEARFSFACQAGSIDGVVVNGTYLKGAMADGSHYVEIPISVTSDGTTVIETDFVNGLKFSSGSVDLKTTTSSVKLYAQGIPAAVGNNFKYTPTGASCTFTVPVSTNMGSFNNPAKSCHALLTEDPSKKDGEYWIQLESGSSSPVKTFCDMTNGGYTLIWSYSENTARNVYVPVNNMSIYGEKYLRYNSPYNVVSSNGVNDTIKYENYRLALNTMKNTKNSTVSEYKVRIAYDPKDVNDAWGKENYFDIKPSTAYYDFLSSTVNSYTWSGTNVATTGKLYNVPYAQTSGSIITLGTYTRDANVSALYYGSSAYSNHWDVGNRVLYSGAYDTTITKNDGATMNVGWYPVDLNNVFGFFGETEINHHFGKCGQNGDDYSFTTRSCLSTSLYPHSFNNGQGRYLQWFIK